MSLEHILALAWLLVSVCLDMVANWALKRSEGFRHTLWGLAAIAFISLAFACMGNALLVMPLSIVYALWSVLGICGTLLMGKFIFNQQVTRQKYIAVAMLTAGIVLMNLG